MSLDGDEDSMHRCVKHRTSRCRLPLLVSVASAVANRVQQGFSRVACVGSEQKIASICRRPITLHLKPIERWKDPCISPQNKGIPHQNVGCPPRKFIQLPGIMPACRGPPSPTMSLSARTLRRARASTRYPGLSSLGGADRSWRAMPWG